MIAPDASLPTHVPPLARLYVTLAYRTDADLAEEELGAVLDRLHLQAPRVPVEQIEEVVADALFEVQQGGHDALAEASAAARVLAAELDAHACERVLEDLLVIAEADGVFHPAERLVLRTCASIWGLPTPRMPVPALRPRDPASLEHVEREPTTWTLLHGLAYVYLALAHGADGTLSENEIEVILRKLREWHPTLRDESARLLLDHAAERFLHDAKAEDGGRRAYRAVLRDARQHLDEQGRMLVINDLVEIAFADDVLYAAEETLIYDLIEAWEVQPFAQYGRSPKPADAAPTIDPTGLEDL